MALDDDIRVLSGVGLFEGLTPDQLRLLAFGAERVRFAAGDAVYGEGAQADSAYVVVHGRIALFHERAGQRIESAIARPGAILGELALIAETRRLTSAEAVEDTLAIRLDRKLVRRMLEEYPEVAEALHQRIVEDIQRMIRQLEQLASRLGD